MAIDQRDVSSTLRFMDDRALQQYAAMHKNDPYIFPLAFQESQNRQRLRMSQQGAQGMQPQPKVADQALAQMAPQPLPEDVGIGALPAPNMTMAAEGGIMGYEGYDEGPSDFGQGPVMMMSGGGVARYNGAQGSAVSLNAIESKYQKELQEINTGARVQYSPDVQEYVNARAQTSPDSTPVQVNPIPNAPPQAPARPPLGSSLSSSLYSNITPKERARFDALQAAKQKNALKTPFEQERTANMAEIAKGSTYTPEAYSVTKPAPIFSDAQRSQALVPSAEKPKEIIKDERKDTERKETGRKETGRKDPSAKTDTGELDSIINSYTRALDLGIGESRNARVGLAAALEQTPKTRAKRNAEERAKEGDVFAGREARLAEREKGIEGMGDKYLGLALLQAGAAMMSTPGNIGAALGKGIAVGSERYIAGIDKINAAKDKFAEARDRLEDLRLNRADMTKKEIREDQRAIDDGILQAKKLLVDGATNDLKISADAQTKIFGAVTDNFQTNNRIKSAENIAALDRDATTTRANAPSASMREAMLLGTGSTDAEKYESGLKKMKELTGDKQGTQLLKLFLEENARREKDMQKPLTLEQFRRTSAAFFAPPAPVDTTKPTRP